jgi:hypothetical protein
MLLSERSTCQTALDEKRLADRRQLLRPPLWVHPKSEIVIRPGPAPSEPSPAPRIWHEPHVAAELRILAKMSEFWQEPVRIDQD